MVRLTVIILFIIFHNTMGDQPPPTKHPNWKLLQSNLCGKSITKRIIGGTRARLGQFPWMVKVGVSSTELSFTTFFGCTGALINKFYVLTAAHCVYPSTNSSLYVKLIRLGDFDTGVDINCDGSKCAPKAQEIPPETIVIHPNYNDTHYRHDVALIRLKAPAKLNGYVEPICMPYGALLKKNNIPNFLEVAGWGYTQAENESSMSTVPFWIRLPLKNFSECQKAFPMMVMSDKDQICAGGEINKDTCAGDSGGPLVAPTKLDGTPQYFLFGIVSYGATSCGMELPAVYTRVGSYLNWILDNIKP